MESNMIKTAICDNNLNNAIIIKNSIEQFSNKFRLRCDISLSLIHISAKKLRRIK